MIETLAVLFLGAYARSFGLDPFWFVAFAFFTGTLLSRIVRGLFMIEGIRRQRAKRE